MNVPVPLSDDTLIAKVTAPADRRILAISALMATYQGDDPDHFSQALASLWAQQAQPAEVVVVLDGPVSDAHRQVLARYAARDDGPLLRVEELTENVGIGAAINVGLRQCSYDIVARLDSDDIALPERFALQWEALDSDPSLDLVASWHGEFHTDPSEVVCLKAAPERHEDIVAALVWRCVISNPTTMFRRRIADAIGGYRSMRVLEDYDFFLRLIRNGARMRVLQQPLTLVRVSPAQRARRGGWAYVRTEIGFRLDCWRAGDISFLLMLSTIVVWLPFRLAPPPLKAVLYRFVRRHPPRHFHDAAL